MAHQFCVYWCKMSEADIMTVLQNWGAYFAGDVALVEKVNTLDRDQLLVEVRRMYECASVFAAAAAERERAAAAERERAAAAESQRMLDIQNEQVAAAVEQLMLVGTLNSPVDRFRWTSPPGSTATRRSA